MERGRIVRRLGLDVVLWYCLPACFLAAYTMWFGRPGTSVGPHILLVTLPFLVLQTLRLLLQRWTTRARLRQGLLAVLATIFFGLLATYYLLVIAGLKSWGGVVTREVIPTFFAQAVVLTDSLAVPGWTLAAAGVVFAAVLFTLCWLYAKRFDWIGAATASIPRPILTAATLAAAAFVALEVHQFSVARWSSSGEPLSLTFFPPAAVLDLEGYSVNPVTASRFDRLEDQARASYQPLRGTKRNLVMIVVDALRPDHLSIYGYPRQTTPYLTRIVNEQPARIVKGVHSSCGDTACALYSLFSSHFPSGFSFRPFALQEALQRNGYHIHLVLSGDYHFFHANLQSIYGHVDTFYDGTQAKDYYLNDDALVVEHLGAMPDWDDTPVMLQFHLMSAHILRKPDDTPGPFQPARRYAVRNSRDIGSGGASNTAAVNFYDNGVRNADSVINELLVLLQRKGYLQNTLVVITADHGESLGEHGVFTHANSVREEVLNVPLLLISFGYEISTHTPEPRFPAQVDIAPTIMAELGLPVPQTWVGRDLNSGAGLPLTFFEEHAFAGLLDCRDAAHTWKYWIDRKSGAEHVFNLNTDPHEMLDVRDTIPAPLLAQLRQLNRSATAADLEVTN